MKFLLIFVGILVVPGAVPDNDLFSGALQTTAERIANHGYPVETHTVQTPDGYVVTMFRIPKSPRNKRKSSTPRPVVFLQHGLLSSSDCFILNGPDNALAYQLADAGYDVWMGNARGNTYSKRNVNISYLSPKFWQFSWNEIGLIDMPAMIDYALSTTKEKALHYVGHSQGTTVFFVLMSSIPSYNAKIKTSHMLSPVAFGKHVPSLGTQLMAGLLGNPSELSVLIGSSEFLPSTKLMGMMGSIACENSSPVQFICSNILFLICGYDSKHLNYTLLSEAAATHPAGASSGQLVHYLQAVNSGHFRKYDYGLLGNLLKYNYWSPPDYPVETISAPVWLYYSDNDQLAAVEDVLKMQKLLPIVEGFRVPIPEWNHFDFLWANEVKTMINDRIIKVADTYEKKK